MLAPKVLPKRELDCLFRTAEQDGNQRNLAILLTLRYTGLHVGKGSNVCLGDIAVSQRS